MTVYIKGDKPVPIVDEITQIAGRDTPITQEVGPGFDEVDVDETGLTPGQRGQIVALMNSNGYRIN